MFISDLKFALVILSSVALQAFAQFYLATHVLALALVPAVVVTVLLSVVHIFGGYVAINLAFFKGGRGGGVFTTALVLALATGFASFLVLGVPAIALGLPIAAFMKAVAMSTAIGTTIDILFAAVGLRAA